jgi:hypothetical protein
MDRAEKSALDEDLALLDPVPEDFQGELVVPAIVEGLFAADCMLDSEIEVVLAGLADVDIGDAEDAHGGAGTLYRFFADIAVVDFHFGLSFAFASVSML